MSNRILTRDVYGLEARLAEAGGVATDTTAGRVRLATDAEAADGMRTDVAVTPAQLGTYGGGGGGGGSGNSYFPGGW
jgi:hypothetical protein